MTGLQIDRLLSYTKSRDQRDEQANPDPNPGKESPQPLVSFSPCIFYTKWTEEKCVQQLPAGSNTLGERMSNGVFVNNAIRGCMYFVSMLPMKKIRKITFDTTVNAS